MVVDADYDSSGEHADTDEESRTEPAHVKGVSPLFLIFIEGELCFELFLLTLKPESLDFQCLLVCLLLHSVGMLALKLGFKGS